MVWIIYSFYLWKHQNYSVQKWITFIPVTKCLWLLQLYLEYSTCPWDQETAWVYLTMFAEQILTILTVICFQTVVNCMFYLMSHGWCTTVQYVERNVITNVMIIGGSLYLLQLANNYSSQSSGQNIFPMIFEMVLGLEYLLLLIICLRNVNS